MTTFTNERLAQEIEILFVRPMPPKDFFGILLNVSHDANNLKPIDLSPFHRVSGAQDEPEMHQQSVSILFIALPPFTIKIFEG